jgi:hypothetical protein
VRTILSAAPLSSLVTISGSQFRKNLQDSHIMRVMRCPRYQTTMKHVIAIFVLSGFGAISAIAACSSMDNDSHFRKIYEDHTVRVFTLELGRLESTTAHCHEHPYFYVVTSESQTTDTPQGHAGWSHNWNSGEARFVATPKQHIVRNETAALHREVVVEILSKVEFNPLTQNYETDDFSGDLGSAKATWTASIEHGPMSAVKTQIGPADKLDVSGRTRLLIALTDLSLSGLGKNLQLSRQDVEVLSADSDFTLTNTARFPAKFITIAF